MNEQHPEDQPDERPVLLQLRLRGKILDPASPASAALVGTGHASSRGEHLILSPAGRATAETEFRFDPDDPAGHHETTRAAYEQFLPRNVELIRVCNDWQVRPGGVPNDHRDAKYDWEVIDKLDKGAPFTGEGALRSQKLRGVTRKLEWKSFAPPN